jgi:hypothetical protein
MPLTRRAAIASLIIFGAFLIHNVNALYIEPNILGFKDPRVDYAKIELLKNAVGSVPWTLSGLGHFVTGFAMVYLALGARGLFRNYKLTPSRVAMLAALIGAVGFMLTGISDLIGGGLFGLPNGAVKLMVAQNPDLERPAYLAMSLGRIVFNCLAQVGLGWYAVLVSWCGRRTGLLPAWFCYFGYLSGFMGVVQGVLFFPFYLQFVLIWSLLFAIVLFRFPTVTPAQEAG